MLKPETDNQTAQKNYNIQSNIKTLLGRDCEMEKVMRFFNDIEIFEEI